MCAASSESGRHDPKSADSTNIIESYSMALKWGAVCNEYLGSPHGTTVFARAVHVQLREADSLLYLSSAQPCENWIILVSSCLS